jgi:hypothetical protein
MKRSMDPETKDCGEVKGMVSLAAYLHMRKLLLLHAHGAACPLFLSNCLAQTMSQAEVQLVLEFGSPTANPLGPRYPLWFLELRGVP